MKIIGTVLPDMKKMKISDRVADQKKISNDNAAQKELRHRDRRVVNGEVRYYDTTDQYAIVSRIGKILWFQITKDGDFRI